MHKHTLILPHGGNCESPSSAGRKEESGRQEQVVITQIIKSVQNNMDDDKTTERGKNCSVQM